jgi:hypothetical protein
MSEVSEIQDRASALRGARIEDAFIIEMALVERGHDGLPMFRHRLTPFIQAVRVELRLTDGRIANFGDYQTANGEFPLGVWFTSDISGDSGSGLLEHPIYRIAPQPHIPLGVIDDVGLELVDEGVLQMNLWIDGVAIALRAGEVIEHSSEQFAICDLAGSTLVYLDATDVSHTRFGETLSWR